MCVYIHCVCVCVYIYDGILLHDQKEWNLTICNNMDRTRVDYAKWNKSVRERKLSNDLTHMWNLRYKTNQDEGKKQK